MANNLSDWILIVFGLFLVLDKLLFGLITFDYPEPVAFADDFFGHGLLGLGFIIIGVRGVIKNG